MEKKTIWHTPDEIPQEADYVIAYIKGGSRPVGYFAGDYPIVIACNTVEPIDNQIITSGIITKWTYIKYLKTISKALDVARDMYIKLAGERGLWTCPSENDAKALERNQTIFENLARKEFDKAISEIIGGK